jgi:hypothetical protein
MPPITETKEYQRHQMMKKIIMQRPDAIEDASIQLWEQLIAQLAPIIGDLGFHSLFLRSVHLTAEKFPWIELNQIRQRTDTLLANLKSDLKSRDTELACEASAFLLATFINILASLIGELLTDSILRSAWGADVLTMAAKDL